MSGRSARIEATKARLAASREAAIRNAPAYPASSPAIVADRFGAERAALLARGFASRREADAADRLATVDRMSRAGAKVAEIASATGLAYEYVVELRGRLGVGRKR